MSTKAKKAPCLPLGLYNLNLGSCGLLTKLCVAQGFSSNGGSESCKTNCRIRIPFYPNPGWSIISLQYPQIICLKQYFNASLLVIPPSKLTGPSKLCFWILRVHILKEILQTFFSNLKILIYFLNDCRCRPVISIKMESIIIAFVLRVFLFSSSIFLKWL